jgi:hypothetical protein
VEFHGNNPNSEADSSSAGKDIPWLCTKRRFVITLIGANPSYLRKYTYFILFSAYAWPLPSGYPTHLPAHIQNTYRKLGGSDKRCFAEHHIVLGKENSVTSFRERNIPTKRLPLVDETSANFLRIEGVAWSAQRISLLFLSSSSSVVLTRLSGPRSRPTTSQKLW